MDLRKSFRQRTLDASLRRQARPQPTIATRNGPEMLINGNPLRSSTVSNEPLGTSDQVFVNRDSGVVQQERRRILAEVAPQNPKLKTGEIAVLAYVLNTQTQKFDVYLGGNRRSPILIRGGLSHAPRGYLELVGAGQDDWVVALKWGPTNAKTIAVVHGDQSNQQNWEITDPLCNWVDYRGNGFWSDSQYRQYGLSGLSSDFATVESGSTPFVELGRAVNVAPCYQEWLSYFGSTTVAAAYCEGKEVSGPSSTSQSSYNYRRGFAPRSFPKRFSGINIEESYSESHAELIGAVSGPGFLGPGRAACTPGSPPIIGTAQLPTSRSWGNQRVERRFDTQTYFAYAYNGQIQTTEGVQKIDRLNTYTTDSGSGGGVKSLTYEGSCRSYTSPNADLWSIGIVNIEYWPVVAGFTNQTETGVSVSLKALMQLNPTLQKESNYSGGSSPAQGSGGTGTIDLISFSPIGIGGSTTFYSKEIYTGPAQIGSAAGLYNYSGGNHVFSQWAVVAGSEIELASVLNPLSYTWKSVAGQVLSTAYSVQLQGDFYSKIFQGDQKASINKFLPQQVSGKWEWRKDNSAEQKTALSMAAIGQGYVLAAQYWQR